jgi:hypothetical protein
MGLGVLSMGSREPTCGQAAGLSLPTRLVRLGVTGLSGVIRFNPSHDR